MAKAEENKLTVEANDVIQNLLQQVSQLSLDKAILEVQNQELKAILEQKEG